MMEQWQIDMVQKACKLATLSRPDDWGSQIALNIIDELIATREELKGYEMAAEELKKWKDKAINSFLDKSEDDGWIDVNDRLPEDDLEPAHRKKIISEAKKTVIAVDVCEKIADTEKSYVHSAYRAYNWMYGSWGFVADSGVWIGDKNITHWQYRRKPPVEKCKHPMPKENPTKKELVF